jgi:hypothetical protein
MEAPPPSSTRSVSLNRKQTISLCSDISVAELMLPVIQLKKASTLLLLERTCRSQAKGLKVRLTGIQLHYCLERLVQIDFRLDGALDSDAGELHPICGCK